MHRVTARIDGRNKASARLAARLGLRQEAHLVRNEMFKGEWSDELVFAMLAEEWPGPPQAAGQPHDLSGRPARQPQGRGPSRSTIAGRKAVGKGGCRLDGWVGVGPAVPFQLTTSDQFERCQDSLRAWWRAPARA